MFRGTWKEPLNAVAGSLRREMLQIGERKLIVNAGKFYLMDSTQEAQLRESGLKLSEAMLASPEQGFAAALDLLAQYDALSVEWDVVAADIEHYGATDIGSAADFFLSWMFHFASLVAKSI